MFPKEIKEIKKIAKSVREEFRPYIYKNHKYFDRDYACACAVCSFTLDKILKNKGFKSKFVLGEYDNLCHAFVICNKSIVDITATQFKKSPVYIVDYPDITKKYVILYKSRADLEEQLYLWPEEQTPKFHNKEINRIIKKLSNDKDF